MSINHPVYVEPAYTSFQAWELDKKITRHSLTEVRGHIFQNFESYDTYHVPYTWRVLGNNYWVNREAITHNFFWL